MISDPAAGLEHTPLSANLNKMNKSQVLFPVLRLHFLDSFFLAIDHGEAGAGSLESGYKDKVDLNVKMSKLIPSATKKHAEREESVSHLTIRKIKIKIILRKLRFNNINFAFKV